MMACLQSSSSVSPHRDQVNLVMHSEAAIERVWRCTWRLYSSDLGDELGGSDPVRVEMHLVAAIE